MRVAIVGSRDYPDLVAVRDFVGALPPGTVVLSGCARGVDSIAEDAARLCGLEFVGYPVSREGLPPFPNGRAEFRVRALQRNRRMVDDADYVVAFWDGKSTGTAYTINYARRKGLRCLVLTPGGNDAE